MLSGVFATLHNAFIYFTHAVHIMSTATKAQVLQYKTYIADGNFRLVIYSALLGHHELQIRGMYAGVHDKFATYIKV